MSFVRQKVDRVAAVLLAFGTEGLPESEARQIHAATIATIAIIGVSPAFTLLSLVNGMRLGSPAVLVTFMLSPTVLAPYAVLLNLGYADFAKIAFAAGANMVAFSYSWMFGIDAGLYFYAPALGLVPFFLFGLRQRLRLALFVALPPAAFVIAASFFQAPVRGFELSTDMLHQLWTLNFVSAFLVTACVFAVLAVMVRRAEERLARFSGAVSEYLDSSLVDRLKVGADVSLQVRHLTVFFTDLIGSTRTSFEMGKEQFSRMINEYVREMQEIIKAHGGYMEDVSGDGILGYVGNFETKGPERDAVEVVAMCLKMQERLAELVPRFRSAYGLPGDLRMRIGISSGEATVGKTAGARAIYTANGDVVNLGAKLERKIAEISSTGGILVSQATADLTRDRFYFTAHEIEIGGTRLKAYTVGGDRAGAPGIRGIASA
jgi:class 3 adenylate cyclase